MYTESQQCASLRGFFDIRRQLVLYGMPLETIFLQIS